MIEQALLDHLVVFFRDQELTDAQHRDFAAQFGELEPFVLAPPANPDVPEMHTLAFDNGAAALGSRGSTAGTPTAPFMDVPSAGHDAAGRRAARAYGGDTCWANMYAAYKSLSPTLQEMLDGLDAVHNFMKVTFTTFDDADDPEAELRKVREQYPVMRHPVVRTHPVTKRKLLYVNRNYTTHIDGLSEAENEVLLPFLFDRVKDPAVPGAGFTWAPRSHRVHADNRATQHYAVPDYPGRRLMHRIVIAGDKPFR